MDDHQVHVHRLARFPRDGFHDREAERDVRDEGAVHDVQVEDVRMGIDRFHRFREVEEVGGEEGGRDQHLTRN